MTVHGKERNFKLTVGASEAIAEMCPDGDLARIGEILDGPYTAVAKVAMSVIAELNRGYEEAKGYEEPGYTPDPITIAELSTLEFRELVAMQREALAAFRRDSTPTVEIEPDKDAKKKTSETP